MYSLSQVAKEKERFHKSQKGAEHTELIATKHTIRVKDSFTLCARYPASAPSLLPAARWLTRCALGQLSIVAHLRMGAFVWRGAAQTVGCPPPVC